MWTDSDHVLAGAFGADGLLPYPKRVTVILDDSATVVKSYPDVGPGTHPQQVLEDLAEVLGAE